MRRLFASIIVLLLIALPLQGVAAVAMLHCGPAHERSAGFVSAKVAAASHAHPRGGSAHQHAPSVTGSVDGAEQGADSRAPLSQSGFTCASCAACCAGALIVNTAQAFAPYTPASTESFVPSPVRYSDHTPDRLERPPHTFFV